MTLPPTSYVVPAILTVASLPPIWLRSKMDISASVPKCSLKKKAVEAPPIPAPIIAENLKRMDFDKRLVPF